MELSVRSLRKLEEEAAVMARLRHPHAVSLLGICTMPPCILTEYCKNGSLYSLLRLACSRPEVAAQLTWPVRLRMMLDAATGLLYLHSCSPPIIHRDCKSPNLLVDEHWRVKVSGRLRLLQRGRAAQRLMTSLPACHPPQALHGRSTGNHNSPMPPHCLALPPSLCLSLCLCPLSNFNLSKVLEAQLQELGAESSLAALNPMWQAPEVLAGGAGQAQPASDVFSFGLIMLEVAHRVLNGVRPEVPPLAQLPGGDTAAGWEGREQYCQLMRECWAQDPAARPPFPLVVPRLRLLLERATAAGLPADHPDTL
ncbi:hypothetical protein ABPG75_011770 [Micractinium tetrahymenae]